MLTERRYIHPHDSNYIVVDVLNENGQMVRTYNVRRTDRCVCCGK